MNLENITSQKQEFLKESHQSGGEASEKIIDRLHYRNLHWMAQLDEEEHTWQNMISCTGTDPEDWDEEAKEYDRQAFFERFQEIWEELEVRLSE